MFLTTRWAHIVLPIVAFFVAITFISVQPSDLHRYSQPATVAYTVDIVENGRWLLPQDTLGLATKPPLYNWLGATLAALLGESVFVFKLPSIMAGLSILLMIIFSARLFIPHQQLSAYASDIVMPKGNYVAWFALAAGLIWSTTPLVTKVSYYARPDMLLCAFLTAAWLLSTHLLRTPTCPHRLVKQLALWLCVAAAALTKGPAAILVFVYIFVYSKCLYGSLRQANSTGWRWGIILSLGVFLSWLAGAYVESPKHVRTQLLGYEFVNRIAGVNLIPSESDLAYSENAKSTNSVNKDINLGVNVMDIDWYQLRYYKAKHKRKWAELYQKPWDVLTHFLRQFKPWSLLFLMWFILVPASKWRADPGSAAIIWISLVLLMFVFPTVLRDRYLLPAFPAAAMLAAYVLVNLTRFGSQANVKKATFVLVIAAFALLVGRGVAGLNEPVSEYAAAGDNELIFSRKVRSIVGDDEIVFDYFMGDNNVQALLGYSQPDSPTRQQYDQAQWLIKPIADGGLDSSDGALSVDVIPILISQPINMVTANSVRQGGPAANKPERAKLGLYRLHRILIAP
jgi:4-amino-4-deoxy-L-arabinose transferase-like glycosyltransferase